MKDSDIQCSPTYHISQGYHPGIHPPRHLPTQAPTDKTQNQNVYLYVIDCYFQIVGYKDVIFNWVVIDRLNNVGETYERSPLYNRKHRLPTLSHLK